VPTTSGGNIAYLTVNFTVHLSTAARINWIALNPNNFGQEDYIDILDIQVSSDGSKFSSLEGFSDYEYATTLTKHANEELNPDIVQETMSPDKFKYAGMGIWTFVCPDPVTAIRFSARQTRSYIKPYEVLMVETSQTITTTTTTNPSAWDEFWGAEPETTTSSRNVSRQIGIPYLVGQVTGFDVMNLDPGSQTAGMNVAGVPAVIQAGTAIVGAGIGAIVGGAAAVGTAFAGPIGAAIGFVAGAILGWIFPNLFSSSTQTSTSAGPQTITRQWTVTKTDISRFAIGIRDINIYSYSFATSSEIVSKPYISPAPIYKISLDVDEQIPKEFYAAAAVTANNWIKYYISIDDGVSWNRISPMTHRDTPSEDGIHLVPRIINVNSDVATPDRDNPLAYIDTGSSVYSVRFKAVLSRPTDIRDADSYTPALSSYSLQIYPVGGL
jgi:hypothetical protein